MADLDQFAALFAARVEAAPEACALQVAGRDERWTFAEVDAAALTLAEGLTGKGIKARDRVVLSAPNQPAFVLGLLAIAKAGGIVVPLDPALQYAEAQVILNDAGAQGILCSDATHDTFASLAPERLGMAREVGVWFAAYHGHDATPDLDDIAMFKYTSGTTGTPKGVLLSGAQIRQEGHNVVETLGLSADDTILTAVPLFHSYGFDFCFMPMLLTGATLVMVEKYHARSVLRALREEQITLFPAIPFMLDLLTRIQTDEAQAPLEQLRYCISAAAPLSARTVRRFHEQFGVVICQNYGSSEAGAITLEIRRKPEIPSTCLGQPLRNVTLAIVDEEGWPVADGEVGEVCVGGKQVATGYYRDPTLSEESIRDGQCYTGDLGYLDEDGNLFLSGRKKQFINSGGKKIAPREIEAVLERHELVQEAAVVGAEDEALGEVAKACIVASEAIEPAALIKHCQAHLAAYKVPQRWSFWDELPRNNVGKIDRERLKG